MFCDAGRNAPERVRVEVDLAGRGELARMERMTDAELKLCAVIAAT